MMRAATITAVTAIALHGCSNDRPAPVKLKDIRAQLRSESVPERWSSTFLIRQLCCLDSLEYAPILEESVALIERPPDTAEACRLLTHAIETESDPIVVNNALGPWGPTCYAEVPAAALLTALERSGNAYVHYKIIGLLAGMEPTPDLVRRLVSQLGYDGDKFGVTASDVRLEAAMALATLGEADLGPVVEALESSNPMIRSGARRALEDALEAPLDLPEALDALDRVAGDPDPDAARDARMLADLYRKRAKEPVPVAVERLLAGVEAPDPGRLPSAGRLRLEHASRTFRFLALRRAFCNSKVATAALEQFRGVQDPDIAAAAARGIALRAQRCGP